ncbi:unnamed protein product [Euphydryas editha]|nr:unnamed protein product [Euphydryas editha]
MVKESYNRTPVSQRPMKVLKCPMKPGSYTFDDMKLSLMDVPDNFPFNQGRLFLNCTHKGNIVSSGYVDVELRKVD